MHTHKKTSFDKHTANLELGETKEEQVVMHTHTHTHTHEHSYTRTHTHTHTHTPQAFF